MWKIILKRKVDTYEEYKKERERLLQEQKREQQKILDSLLDESGKRKRFLNDEEMEEIGKIKEPLNNFDEINEEYHDRMISDKKFAEENEKRIKRERERKAQMQGNTKSRRHGGRKKRKKQKPKFDVQRGSGQSKSQRRSGGRDDSKRFRKL